MNGNASKTLERGLRLLKILAGESDGLTVSELAEALSMHRAGVYRLLVPLEEHRLVTRTRDGRYVLGVGLHELAGAVNRRLHTVAVPELAALSDELQLTAFLTIRDNSDAVAVTVVEPRQANMYVAYRVGFRHPVTQGASGIAILAGSPAEPNEPSEITEARERGYALTKGQLQPGAIGVAAPIKMELENRMVEASIGVVGMGTLDEDVVAPRVMDAAATVARAL